MIVVLKSLILEEVTGLVIRVGKADAVSVRRRRKRREAGWVRSWGWCIFGAGCWVNGCMDGWDEDVGKAGSLWLLGSGFGKERFMPCGGCFMVNWRGVSC